MHIFLLCYFGFTISEQHLLQRVHLFRLFIIIRVRLASTQPIQPSEGYVSLKDTIPLIQ